MKKVLTGFCNNISDHKGKIKWWVESFRKHSDADIVLIAANATDDDRQVLSDLNVDYVEVTETDTWRINHQRLIHTKNFIESYDADLFLATDVFDVLFHSDPFEKLDTDNYDIWFSREGILVREEPWNADVLRKTFPNEVNSCMETEIVCSGIMAGKKDAFIKLYDKMYEMCENSEDGHNIKDQAALIVLVKDNWIENLRIFDLDEGWAMHCATSGPTQFFEGWGMKNNILNKGYGIPELKEDGCVYNSRTNNKYCMVHQFNRIEEWKEILTKEYE
jgi:hypothetical protein